LFSGQGWLFKRLPGVRGEGMVAPNASREGSEVVEIALADLLFTQLLCPGLSSLLELFSLIL